MAAQPTTQSPSSTPDAGKDHKWSPYLDYHGKEWCVIG